MSDAGIVTVEAGDFTFESNHHSAAEMIRDLKPSDEKDDAPHEIKPIPMGEKPKSPLSEAAAELGKKGGAAAAKAREKEAKEAKPGKEAPAEDEGKVAAKAKAKAAPAEADDEGEDEGDVLESSPRARARVEQATRKAAEARREVERERARADRLEQRLAALERERTQAAPPRHAAPPAQEDHEPQEGDFETYPEFVKASARWAARQERKAAEVDQIRRAQATQRAQRIGGHVDAFKDRVAKAAEADESFMERTAPLARAMQPSFTLPQGRPPGPIHVLTDEIITSPSAPALMEHFSAHPEEFRSIATLRNPREIARAVAKIEARLEGATAGTTSSDERPGSSPEISKARPPARPVAGSPRIANAEPGDDSSLDEHIAFYDARDKEKRRRRA